MIPSYDIGGKLPNYPNTQHYCITACYRAIGLQGYSVVNNPEQYLLSNVGSTSPLCSRSVGGHFPRTFHCILI